MERKVRIAVKFISINVILYVENLHTTKILCYVDTDFRIVTKKHNKHLLYYCLVRCDIM